MKFSTLIKHIAFGLGALALTVVGAAHADSGRVVDAMSAQDAINNSPWGINYDSGNQTIYDGAASGVGATNSGTYSPLINIFGSGTQSLYLPKKNATFNLGQSKTVSYWLYLSPSSGSAINNGMAFILQARQSNGTFAVNKSLTGTKGDGGATLGAWGDPKSATPWSLAIQNGYAFAFDTHMDESYNPEQWQTGVKSTIYGAPTSLQNVSGAENTYLPYATTSGKWTLNKRGPINITQTGSGTDMPGSWHHVTLRYVSSNSTSGVMSLAYDDRSLSDISVSENDFNKTYNLNSTMFGGATNLAYGFSSSTNAGNNLLVTDTDPSIVDASATATLTDTTKNKVITSATDQVYGGDSLTYQYDVLLNYSGLGNGQGLTGAYIKTTLPAVFNPDTSAVTVKTGGGATSSVDPSALHKNSDGTYTLNQKLPDLTGAGQTATVTVTGKASTVQKETPVSSTSGLAYNRGIDQPLTNSGFLLEPSIITTTNGTVRNLSEVGQPLIANAHVFTGDEIGYTFDLDYDAKQSMVDWNGPINATMTMPAVLEYKDLQNNATYFHVETKDDSGNVIFTKDYSAEDIAAGKVAVTDANGLTRNPIRNHITVTVTGHVNGSGIGMDTVPAATATFATDAHEDTATASAYPLTNVQTDSNDPQISLVADPTTIEADQIGDANEGENYVNVTGSFVDQNVTNDQQVALFVTVNGKNSQNQQVQTTKHIQLNAGGTKQFKLSFNKPTISAQAYDGTIHPSGSGQFVDTAADQMLHLGVNTVSLYAVDQKGNASQPVSVTVNVGLFKFMNATENLDFPTKQLGGSSFNINSSNDMILTMNNSRQESDWSVTAKEASPISNGLDQPVRLMYGDQSLATATTIATSRSGLTTASDGTITLIDSNKDLHVSVNGGAVSGTYKTTVDWTLVNSVQP